MRAVGIDFGGERPVVVDDQWNAEAPTVRLQSERLLPAFFPIGKFVSVLQQCDARAQHRQDARQQTSGIRLIRSKQIKTATGPERRQAHFKDRREMRE
jgi:hypothetical protein